MRKKVLLIDDEPQWVNAIIDILIYDFDIITISSVSDFERTMGSNPDIQAVVIDVSFKSTHSEASRHDGIRLVELLKHQRPDLPIIATSGHLDDKRIDHHFKELAGWGTFTLIDKSEPSAIEMIAFVVREELKNTKEKSTLVETPQERTASIAEVKKILIEEIDKYAGIKEQTISIPGIGNYELIKPLIGFKSDIEKQLAKYPFDKNVFLMMKFREANKELGEFIIENLNKHGLRGVRADQNEWNITKNVYNPIAVLYCCKYGIALFDEPEEYQAYSPNVAYELGMMHYQNKDCLILKHNSLPDIPFDLVKDLYQTYDRDLQVQKKIASWIEQIASM